MGSKKLKIIAIIPARGGSKSIANKNLLKINSKSLVENIYNTAKSSKCFDKIICSTDSKKIINLCKKKKINYIKRPKKISTDKSNVIDTVIHVLKIQNINYDFIALLQPTCLFLNKKHIIDSVNTLKNKNYLKSIQTVHFTPHNYHYINTRIIRRNLVEFKFNKSRIKKFNKQLKEKTFHFGNLILTNTKSLIKEKNFFCKPSGFIEIDKVSSFDLDVPIDYSIAKNINKLAY